jgi:hypothetical protein
METKGYKKTEGSRNEMQEKHSRVQLIRSKKKLR